MSEKVVSRSVVSGSFTASRAGASMRVERVELTADGRRLLTSKASAIGKSQASEVVRAGNAEKKTGRR